MIGEDIEGEYGGAFKVTKDLSIKFPNRVRNTPISEAHYWNSYWSFNQWICFNY